MVFTLEGFAGLAVAVGKPEQASLLIAWTDATRARINKPRPFLEQTNVDQLVAACLARIGSVSFWEAYDEAQKMTIDEAVAHALGEG